MKPAAWFELPMRREPRRPPARIRRNRRAAGSEPALRAASQLCTLNAGNLADALMMNMADIMISPMAQKTQSV
ncbi:hypothetical protein [Thiobacillus sp. 65-1402]|uniref:hypothetical protein n=1 Tax=Thiobacillus sp. 65-1402 TaxID=1895861 RepID=UPI000966E410|nr:hypothetical protein [Thiobacillus sp. 65-1402]OJW99286.1 MAG: hypothetical protein BGO62_06275 [Thiobacillus sp. 65-1402]